MRGTTSGRSWQPMLANRIPSQFAILSRSSLVGRWRSLWLRPGVRQPTRPRQHAWHSRCFLVSKHPLLLPGRRRHVDVDVDRAGVNRRTRVRRAEESPGRKRARASAMRNGGARRRECFRSLYFSASFTRVCVPLQAACRLHVCGCVFTRSYL